MAFDAYDLYQTLTEMIPEGETARSLVNVPVLLCHNGSCLQRGLELMTMQPTAVNNKPESITLSDWER